MVKGKTALKFVFFSFIFLVWSIPQLLFAPSLNLSSISKNSIVEIASYELIQHTKKVQEKQLFNAFVSLYEPYIEMIPKAYRVTVINLCWRYNVPISLLYNLVEKESSWNPKAVSSINPNGSYDRGLMQINTYSQKTLVAKYYSGCTPFDPYKYQDSLEVGIRYLNHLYSVYNSWEMALWAYNAGYTRVNDNCIPYTTKEYARDILDNMKREA